MSKSLKTKLIVLFSLFIAVPIGIQFYFTYTNNVDTLKEKTFEKLVSIRENKAHEVEELFHTMGNQVYAMSRNPLVIDGMEAFSKSFREIKTHYEDVQDDIDYMLPSVESYYRDQFGQEYVSSNNGAKPEILTDIFNSLPDYMLAMQYNYISNNKNPLGSKHLLDKADDGSKWSELHAMKHDYFRSFLETFGYYDIFLVDIESGDIVYSVFKELDFGTSLLTGPYRDTNFADLFRKIKYSDSNDVQIADLERYFPSYELPAGFIGVPVLKDGEKIGALIYQIPVEKIDAIMTSGQNWVGAGFGETGQVYLVGEDQKMRSLSRFFAEDKKGYLDDLGKSGMSRSVIDYIRAKSMTTISSEVKGDGVKEVLAGKTGDAIYEDFRGVPVFSSFRPLDLYGMKWGILSEIDEEEAFRSINSLSQTIMGISIGLLVIGCALAWFFASSLTKPIVAAAKAVKAIADGDLNNQVDVNSKDEVGQMSESINETISRIENAFGSKTIQWMDLEAMKREEQKAIKQAKDDKEAAEAANEKAKEEKASADKAFELAEKSKAEAEEALTLAGEEKKRAEEEGRRAAEAQKEADLAQERAQEAEVVANEEKANAEVAQREALQAKMETEESNKQIQSLLETSEKEAKDLQEKVASILGVVEKASTGDLRVEVTVDGDDPIGKVGRGLKTFFKNIRLSLIDIDSAAGLLFESSKVLKDNSSVLSDNSTKMSSRLDLAHEESEKVSEGISSVASNTEELAASIKEISTITSKATQLVNDANDKSLTANKLIEKLADSSMDIGSVIKLIGSIAEQTNLLALNATIEAARAGEAGKGFAVVANEVKELAKQTANASNEISKKIENIQNDSKGAITSIEDITTVIQTVNENSMTTASAIEEQAATTQEVSKIVQESNSSVQDIARSVNDVQASSEVTLSAVEKNNESANDLTELATKLAELVGHFELGNHDRGSRDLDVGMGQREIGVVSRHHVN